MFGVALVLASYSGANWLSIFADHAPPCSPECTSDFVTFYAAARLLREDAASLYDIDRQFVYQKQIAPMVEVLPFVYPPITAFLLSPLAWFPFSAAFLLATLVNGALLGHGLLRLSRALKMNSDQYQWLWVFTACNYGLHHVLYQGQTSVLVLYLLIGYALAEKQASALQSGFWIGPLSVKPQYLPLPGLLLLLQGRWRALLLGAGFSIVLMAGAFLLIGVDSLGQYLALARRMATAEQDWWNQPRGMHNLRALAITWLPASWKEHAWALSSLIVIAGIVWVNLGSRVEFRRRWIVNSLGLLLATPHLFTHDLTLLILPCALSLSLCGERVPLFVGVGWAMLGVLPIAGFVLPTVVAAVLIILYAAGLIFCWRSGRNHNGTGGALSRS
jgi:hypothetical protein